MARAPSVRGRSDRYFFYGSNMAFINYALNFKKFSNSYKTNSASHIESKNIATPKYSG